MARKKTNSESLPRRVFWRLESPRDDPHKIYGLEKWQRLYDLASWSKNVGGLSTGRLTRPYGEPRVDLAIVLPSPRVGDFVWTWYSDCIVTERVLSLFTDAGFTGFEPHPVLVEKVDRVGRKRKEELDIPRLWELAIRGKGGDAAPESGIHVIDKDEDTGFLEYSSFLNGIIVEEANWDGSDFFTINGYPMHILVSERVKQLIVDHHLTNCALTPSHKLEWTSGERPEESLQRHRELTSRPLKDLLADLKTPDLLGDAIYGLGCKGDPRALDPIIGKFDDPNPSIWYAAAGAAASIAKHKETPAHIREEIFSKLCRLLEHEDPFVRRTTGAALGYVGSDRAVEQVMILLDDPEDWVREHAVFVMGYRRHKPAMEHIRRLTRDRSKAVREQARKVVLELESAFP